MKKLRVWHIPQVQRKTTGHSPGGKGKCIEFIADMLKPEKLTISTYLTVNWTQSITLQNVTVLTKN